jgi:translocator protein
MISGAGPGPSLARTSDNPAMSDHNGLHSSPSPARPRLGVQVLALAGWIALAFAAAGVGAIASIDAAAFYAQLDKPAWAPPASVFGPVWSVLYLLMGVSSWLVWREPGDHRRALAWWVAQLVANTLWSWLFFAWMQGAWAFADAVLLLVLVAITLVAFWRVRPLAAVLLVPYLAWVGFAAALTWRVWQGNPGLL